MHTIVRSCLTLALAGGLLGACSAAASTPGPSALTSPDPTPTTTHVSAPTAVPSSTPTPVPATDGQGDEYVTGTETVVLTTSFTETKVGDVTQIRGGVVTITATMNDPRVSGTGTSPFSIDAYTKVGPEWGPFHLENADGAWDGTCTGGSWDSGDSALRSCWLTGSGKYKGYSYYHQATLTGAGAVVEGIIYPGSPPNP